MLSIKYADISGVDYYEEKVTGYSTRKLFEYGFIFPKNSVLNMRMMIRTLVLCAFATLLMFGGCPAKTEPWEFCFPVLSSSDGMIFASLVSFLLGLFQSTTFARWWSVREKIGSVMNNIGIVSLMLSSCVSGNQNVINLRAKIIRWLNLSHALLYKHAVKNSDFSIFIRKDLATAEEVEILGNSPTPFAVPLKWAIQGVRELVSKNAFTPVGAVPYAAIQNIYTAGQEAFAFLETQMPYSYLHLITMITKIHLVFIVFYGASILGGGVQTHSWSRIVFGYALIITNNVIYEGLLAIHDMLVNPLGTDEADFPTELYEKKTESFSQYIQGGVSPSGLELVV